MGQEMAWYGHNLGNRDFHGRGLSEHFQENLELADGKATPGQQLPSNRGRHPHRYLHAVSGPEAPGLYEQFAALHAFPEIRNDIVRHNRTLSAKN